MLSVESRRIVVIVALLLGIGSVVLFSATGIYGEVKPASSVLGDPFHFLKRHVAAILCGLVAMLFCARVRLATWRRLSLPLLIATTVLLVLVLIPGVGHDHATGARRWFRIAGVSFQPSELAKLVGVLFIASLLARDPARIRKFGSGFLPAIGIVGGVSLIVILGRDVGTSLFIGGVLSLTMLVGGARIRHFAPFALAAAGGLMVLVLQSGHVRDRVQTWLNPADDPLGKGHQIRQSLTALGSGGLLGTGLGRSTQKLLYLPERHTDFIFAILGEELGFVGALGVVALFGALGWYGWAVCRRAREPFGLYLSFGLTANILLQAALNIAVVTAAIPTKGIPLPLMSFGGTSLTVALASLGILIGCAEEERRAAEERAGKRRECTSSSPAGVPEAICSPASL